MINREFAGGLAMLIFAAIYALAAGNLSMTSSLGIGSGLFPMMLAGLLAVLGIVVALGGRRAARRTPVAAPEEGEAPLRTPYRALILITAAPIIFALLVVPTGFVPALTLAVFLSAFASRETSFLGAALTSLALALFCVALFRWGLGLPITLFGPLFRLAW